MSELYAEYAAFVEVRDSPSGSWRLLERFDFGTDREHVLFVAIGNTSGLTRPDPQTTSEFYEAHHWEMLCTLTAEQANPFKVIHPDWKYVVRLARKLEGEGREYRVVWAFDSY